MITSPPQTTLTRDAMIRYRQTGYQPLPSRSDKKAPTVPYRDYWRSLGPDGWLDTPARNIQVMTGAYWRLAVLDLDGPTAIEVYRTWSLYRDLPPTWESAHTPSKGRHLWYSLPADLRSCPTRFVWELAGAKHEAIEILGDEKLVVAPPSKHVKTGRRYRWFRGRSPRSIERPALIPDWLLAMPDVRPIVEIKSVIRPDRKPLTVHPGERHHSRDVRSAVVGKAALAASWGLRFADKPANAKGWIPCHAINREDVTPSAGFNDTSGYYCEPKVIRLSLFDLAVALGIYSTWTDARDDLGERYGSSLT